MEVGQRAGKTGGAEEDPCNQDENEGQCDARRAGKAAIERVLATPSFHRENRSVDGAPNDECPVRAVPESAQEHDQGKVQVGAARSFLVAAERDVEVVAQPGGKRNVPASPKVRDAFGEIGTGEVFGDFES